MGNMAACLAQQRTTTAVPAVSPKRGRLISLKLLMKAIRRMKTKRAKIDSKSSSSSSLTMAAAAEDGSKGGGGGGVEEKSKVAVSNNPKGAVLRSRLHGRGGGGLRKGAVRVKVVLTKEEAARLLSLTVGGQKTAATQIVAEIKRMEARRAANAAAAAWRPALASIPEESA
ncbi:hypothetical protein GQ55_5G529000 [Panicum hallii var. hallii]|uniref:DUF7890 domain-containing protein n=1 Tax=Panicum hallii var. hallii TaxID=1504633 RepID=A0A2T7DSZ0_9POAL|nr:hypothetical protein GQ55_5G529000 [Panicum hallii var. hallii]